MRKYRLVSDVFAGFFTGHSGDRQVITGYHLPGLLTIFFDRNGDLLNAQETSFPQEWIDEWDKPSAHPLVLTGNSRPRSSKALKQLFHDIGFVEGSIAVKPFSLLPTQNVCLDEVTGDVRDILENPDDYPADELKSAKSILKESSRLGGPFGFVWDNDYFMNADGTIDST